MNRFIKGSLALSIASIILSSAAIAQENDGAESEKSEGQQKEKNF